jgi:hypothetical protein
MTGPEGGVPIQEFIQALSTQLDHAQTAMGVKARNLNLPLTFAVKDIAIDMRAHIDFVRSEVRIRPAGPGEGDAHRISLALTTITRPMIEENAPPGKATSEEPSIKEAVGSELNEEEQRRLEWAGIQTVGQLRQLQQSGADRSVERVANLPVERLRRALQHAALPFVSHIVPEAPGADSPLDAAALLRLRGRNLMQHRAPSVTIAGEAVRVLRASPEEVVVAPLGHQMSGTLELKTDDGEHTALAFDLRAPVPAQPDERIP